MTEATKTGRGKSGRGKKLLYFLSRMEADEIKDFDLFLDSPLLGNSQQARRMLGIVVRECLEKGMEALEIEMFREEFFPDSQPDAKLEKYIWVRIANLQEKLMDFVAFSAQNETVRPILTFRGFRQRGWDKYAGTVYKKAVSGLEKVGSGSLIDFVGLDMERLFWNIRIGKERKREVLDRMVNHVDLYFILQKLKLEGGSFFEQLGGAPPLENEGFELALEWAQKPGFFEIPVVNAYVHGCKMFQAHFADDPAAEDHFQKLRAWMQKLDAFERDEARDLFMLAQNFVVVRIHQGKREENGDLQFLFDQVLKSGVILENGLLPPEFYRNMVLLMLRFGQKEWARTTNEEWQDRIKADPEKLVYKYNSASIFGQYGEWQKVVEVLYNVLSQYENLSMAVGVRLYFCRALWMQQEYEWLLNSLKSFQQFLRRQDEISSQDRKRHLRYIAFFRKLVIAETSRSDKKQAKFQKLREEMAGIGGARILGWLGSQIQNRLGK